MRLWARGAHVKDKAYPVIIEEIKSLEIGSHKASIRTWNWSDGSKPNMPDIVLFIASMVVGGTSFWIRLTSKGSISWIKFERTDFWKELKKQKGKKRAIFNQVHHYATKISYGTIPKVVYLWMNNHHLRNIQKWQQANHIFNSSLNNKNTCFSIDINKTSKILQYIK